MENKLSPLKVITDCVTDIDYLLADKNISQYDSYFILKYMAAMQANNVHISEEQFLQDCKLAYNVDGNVMKESMQ
jgi:hypothetical protein